MTEYLCKCGKTIRKSSNADVTGNRLEGYAPGHECFGCPYVVEQTKYNPYPEQEIFYECEMTKSILSTTRTDGFDDTKNSATVYSLDFDFLTAVADACREQKYLTINQTKAKDIFCYKSSYCADGLYRFTIYPAASKAGVAAKQAIFDQFFNEDGMRKDTGGADEMEIVQAQIARGKALAREEDLGTVSIEADVPDINVASIPEEDNRSTLVASPLDVVSAALAPAFDYSSVDEKTAATLHVAENMLTDAWRSYLFESAAAVGIAHEALCGELSHSETTLSNGNRGESAFSSWCESMGIARATAYRLLQANKLINSATPSERDVLMIAPATLIYAAAKPSAPTELVEAVKSGDITTSAEYKKLLAEKQEAEARAAKLNENLEESLAKSLERCRQVSAAERKVLEAEEKAEQAKRDFKTVSDVVTKKTKENAALRHEMYGTEQIIRELEQRNKELEARPVEVAVQPPSEADIARYRAEGAKAATAEWQERYEDIEAQNMAYKDMMREKDAQLAEFAAYEPEPEPMSGDTAAIIYELGKRTAETVECALKMFFEAAAPQPDVIYLPAVDFIHDISRKLRTALEDDGQWPEDEGSEHNGI